MDHLCWNHPERQALSFCHSCKEYYCGPCLDEGGEYYYCRKPACQEALQKQKGTTRRKSATELISDDELIPFRAFQNNFEAQVAQSKLEAHRIECFLSGEIMNQMYPGSLISPPFGSVKLWIRRSDKSKAMEILGTEKRHDC
jgi:hypothetical protein